MADAAMGDGYTINDDLRAQGLHGNDEDDAGAADAADPLLGAGASAATPVDVDASPTNSTAGKRSRKRTSDVWKEMEELTRKDPVTGKQVTYGAICNYCKSRYSASSTGGTGHLRCHLKSCRQKTLAASSSSQSHLHHSFDGTVKHF